MKRFPGVRHYNNIKKESFRGKVTTVTGLCVWKWDMKSRETTSV
jgi:hypothetical protein